MIQTDPGPGTRVCLLSKYYLENESVFWDLWHFIRVMNRGERHLDEKSAEKTALTWVVWKENEKTVGQDGKRPKDSWNRKEIALLCSKTKRQKDTKIKRQKNTKQKDKKKKEKKYKKTRSPETARKLFSFSQVSTWSYQAECQASVNEADPGLPHWNLNEEYKPPVFTILFHVKCSHKV